MKKTTILIVFHDLSKQFHAGGNIRVKKLIYYLQNLGYELSLVTFPSSNELSIGHSKFQSQVSEITYLKSRSIEKPFNLRHIEFGIRLWFKFKSIIKKHNPDVVLFDSPPSEYLFTILKLRKIFSGPIVLDLRDAWTLDPYQNYQSFFGKIFFRVFQVPIEPKVLKNIDLLITTTESTARNYKKKYPDMRSKIRVIPNGYDEEDIQKISPSKTDKTFTICYSGTLRRAENSLWIVDAAKELQKIGNIIFQFVGSVPESFLNKISEKNCEDVIEITPPVKPIEALQYVKDSHVAFLLQNSMGGKLNAVAGKTYEYIALGKPILMVSPPGENVETVKKYAKINSVITYDSTDNLKDSFIKEVKYFYNLWLSGQLHDYMPNTEFMNRYSRRSIALSYHREISKLIHL